MGVKSWSTSVLDRKKWTYVGRESKAKLEGISDEEEGGGGGGRGGGEEGTGREGGGEEE
jgi:hypothetical protein